MAQESYMRIIGQLQQGIRTITQSSSNVNEPLENIFQQISDFIILENTNVVHHKIINTVNKFIMEITLLCYTILPDNIAYLVYINLYTALADFEKSPQFEAFSKNLPSITEKLSKAQLLAKEMMAINQYYNGPLDTPINCTDSIEKYFVALWAGNPIFTLALLTKIYYLGFHPSQENTQTHSETQTFCHKLFTLLKPDQTPSTPISSSSALRITTYITFVNPAFLKTLSQDIIAEIYQHLTQAKLQHYSLIFIALDFYIYTASHLQLAKLNSQTNTQKFISEESIFIKAGEMIRELDNTHDKGQVYFFKDASILQHHLKLIQDYMSDYGLPALDLSPYPLTLSLDILRILLESDSKKLHDIDRPLKTHKLPDINKIISLINDYYKNNHFLITQDFTQLTAFLNWLSTLKKQALIDSNNSSLAELKQTLKNQLSNSIFVVLSFEDHSKLHDNLSAIQQDIKDILTLTDTNPVAQQQLQEFLGHDFINILHQQTKTLQRLLLLFPANFKLNQANTAPITQSELVWFSVLEFSITCMTDYFNCLPSTQWALLNKTHDLYLKHQTPNEAYFDLLISCAYYLFSSSSEKKNIDSTLMTKFDELKKYAISPDKLKTLNQLTERFMKELVALKIISKMPIFDTEKAIDALREIIQQQLIGHGKNTSLALKDMAKLNSSSLSALSQEADLKAKLAQNKKNLSSTLDKIIHLLKQINIKLTNNYSDINNLIRELGKTVRTLQKKLSQKPKDKQLNQSMVLIQELAEICINQLSLENKTITTAAETEIKFIRGVCLETDNPSTVQLLQKNLKSVLVKFEKFSFNQNNDVINFYTLLKELLSLFQDEILITSLDSIIHDKEITKTLTQIRGKITHHFSSKFDVKKMFGAFLSSSPGNIHFRSTLLPAINYCLALPENFIQNILREDLVQTLKSRAKTLNALDKIELFLALDITTDTKYLNKAHELAQGFFDIKFSEFQYNADIVGYFYQKLNFFPELKLRAPFCKALSDYVSKIQLDPLQEDNAIILLLYITTSQPSHYFTLSQDTQLSLRKISQKLAESDKSVFYDYFLIYTSALDLINKFDNFDQEKKFLAAKTILNWLRALQNAEYNHPDSSPFNFLIEDSLGFINQQLALKLNRNSELPELISESTESKLNAEQLILQLEKLLHSVNAFQKDFHNINPAMTHAGSFTTQQTIRTTASMTNYFSSQDTNDSLPSMKN